MFTLWIEKRFASLIETVKSYRLASLCLWILCVLFNVLIWTWNDLDVDVLVIIWKIIMVIIAVVFLFSITTKITKSWSKKWFLFQWITLLFATLYYIILPWFEELPTSWIIQHGLIQWVVILALLVIPLWYSKRGKESMYESIIHLILHFALAVIFSWLLAWWISLALLWVQTLFDVSIDWEWYWTIFATIGILFWWLSFLDWIRTWDVSNTIRSKSAKWKTMLWRVVWLLLLLYAAILYVYLAKILVTRERPSNQVTLRSFVFSVLIVLWSILLVPLIDTEFSEEFHQRCMTVLYVLLLPVCVMVACAIWIRIEQYWLTESRYLVVAVLLRLVLSCCYMIISKEKDLRTIAALLLWIWIISIIAGPFSMRSMSLNNQLSSLSLMIETDNLMSDTSELLVKEKINVLSNEKKQLLASKIKYIVDHHWYEFVSYFTWTSSDYWYDHLEKLWLENIDRWVKWIYWSTNRYFNSDYASFDAIDVSEYSQYYKNVSDDLYSLDWALITMTLWEKSYSINISEFIETLEQKELSIRNQVPRLEFTIKYDDLLMIFDYISYDSNAWKVELNWLGFDLAVE